MVVDDPVAVSTLKSAGFSIALNPVPDVPEEPFAPDVPEVPLVPLVPDVPEVPLVPLVPDVPEEPFAPDVPEEPFAPDVPDEPSPPEAPSRLTVAIPDPLTPYLFITVAVMAPVPELYAVTMASI